MDVQILQVALLAVLIVVNGLLAGSEMALVSLRESQLRQLEERGGKRARALAALARDPNRFLSAVQVGITLSGFLASAVAAVSLAEPLAALLDSLGPLALPAAIVLVTSVLTFVTLVFGELAPKRIAMQRAEGWALFVARPLNLLAIVTLPAVWLLGGATNAVLRLLGLDPSAHREAVSEEELREIVASQASLTPIERQIIAGALEFGDRTLLQILVPRNRVFTLPKDLPAPEALQQMVASGHSRAPVVGEGGLDDQVGVVHLRDLFHTSAPLASLANPAPVFPETLTALEALRRLQEQHQQLAIVLNEHLAAEGIVTVEDILEEVVGEIYDEVDKDILRVVREADGGLVVPGSFPVHDLPDLGVELPEGQYATVAGLLIQRLQALPDRPGQAVEIEGWRLEVIEMRGRAIDRVRLRRLEEPTEDG